MARKFGMTHFIHPDPVENVVDNIIQLTDGGAGDFYADVPAGDRSVVVY